jgi:hypothetical protein
MSDRVLCNSNKRCIWSPDSQSPGRVLCLHVDTTYQHLYLGLIFRPGSIAYWLTSYSYGPRPSIYTWYIEGGFFFVSLGKPNPAFYPGTDTWETNWYIYLDTWSRAGIWKKRGTIVTGTPFGFYDLVYTNPPGSAYQYDQILHIVSTILKFTVTYDVEFPLTSGGTVTTTIDILCEGIVPINIYNIIWPTPWSSAVFTPCMIQPNETVTVSATVTLPPEAQEQRIESGLVLIEADVSAFKVIVDARNSDF